ncbi:hypothetical protein BESB_040180 [Besnoitia besnoiti]|uniref:RING-type domain-containing protein n=1 Tax=Besnoitia besnoiti TaxID=94643 RepID=A0A2A9MP54_BESBE|nr:hypothetical protein BESB_040180 [Besnoitia besnoiti]PFH37560.1 hypothetical protein BESB_040180 [Besnoitia besnoiti]
MDKSGGRTATVPTTVAASPTVAVGPGASLSLEPRQNGVSLPLKRRFSASSARLPSCAGQVSAEDSSHALPSRQASSPRARATGASSTPQGAAPDQGNHAPSKELFAVGKARGRDGLSEASGAPSADSAPGHADTASSTSPASWRGGQGAQNAALYRMYRADSRRLTLSGLREPRQVSGLASFLCAVTATPAGALASHRTRAQESLFPSKSPCSLSGPQPPSSPFSAFGTASPSSFSLDAAKLPPSADREGEKAEETAAGAAERRQRQVAPSPSSASSPSSFASSASSPRCGRGLPPAEASGPGAVSLRAGDGREPCAPTTTAGSSRRGFRRLSAAPPPLHASAVAAPPSSVLTSPTFCSPPSSPSSPSGALPYSAQMDARDAELRGGALASVFVDDAPAEVAVAVLKELRAFPRLCKLQLHLWGVEWTPKMIALLGEVFEASAETLESVALRCRVDGDVLTAMLQKLPTGVRYLDVSENMLGGERSAVPALEVLLRRNRLQTLKVAQVGWARAAKERFAKAVEGLGVYNCLQWLEGVDLSECLSIPPHLFMQAALPAPPCSSSAAAVSPLAHLRGSHWSPSAPHSATQSAAAVTAKSLPATTVNFTLLRYLRIRTFLPMLVGSKVRVWWKPTRETQRTDFSGRYWPARILHGCPETLVCKLVYDNNEEDFISLRFLQPYPPFKYGGGWAHTVADASSSASSRPAPADCPAAPTGPAGATVPRPVSEGPSAAERQSPRAARVGRECETVSGAQRLDATSPRSRRRGAARAPVSSEAITAAAASVASQLALRKREDVDEGDARKDATPVGPAASAHPGSEERRPQTAATRRGSIQEDTSQKARAANREETWGLAAPRGRQKQSGSEADGDGEVPRTPHEAATGRGEDKGHSELAPGGSRRGRVATPRGEAVVSETAHAKRNRKREADATSCPDPSSATAAPEGRAEGSKKRTRVGGGSSEGRAQTSEKSRRLEDSAATTRSTPRTPRRLSCSSASSASSSRARYPSTAPGAPESAPPPHSLHARRTSPRLALVSAGSPGSAAEGEAPATPLRRGRKARASRGEEAAGAGKETGTCGASAKKAAERVRAADKVKNVTGEATQDERTRRRLTRLAFRGDGEAAAGEGEAKKAATRARRGRPAGARRASRSEASSRGNPGNDAAGEDESEEANVEPPATWRRATSRGDRREEAGNAANKADVNNDAAPVPELSLERRKRQSASAAEAPEDTRAASADGARRFSCAAKRRIKKDPTTGQRPSAASADASSAAAGSAASPNISRIEAAPESDVLRGAPAGGPVHPSAGEQDGAGGALSLGQREEGSASRGAIERRLREKRNSSAEAGQAREGICCSPFPVAAADLAEAAALYPHLFEQRLHTYLRATPEEGELAAAQAPEDGAPCEGPSDPRGAGEHAGAAAGEHAGAAAGEHEGGMHQTQKPRGGEAIRRRGGASSGTRRAKGEEKESEAEEAGSRKKASRGSSPVQRRGARRASATAAASESAPETEKKGAAATDSFASASTALKGRAGDEKARGQVKVGTMPVDVIGNVLLPGELCEFRDEEEHRGSDPSDFVGMVVAVNSEEPLYAVRYVYHDDDTLLQINSSDIRRAVVVPLDSWIAWRFAYERLRLRQAESRASLRVSEEKGAPRGLLSGRLAVRGSTLTGTRALAVKREPEAAAAEQAKEDSNKRRKLKAETAATGVEQNAQGTERHFASGGALMNRGDGACMATAKEENEALLSRFPSFRDVPPFATFYMLPLATTAKLQQLAVGHLGAMQRNPMDLKLLPADDFAEAFAVRQAAFARERQQLALADGEASGDRGTASLELGGPEPVAAKRAEDFDACAECETHSSDARGERQSTARGRKRAGAVAETRLPSAASAEDGSPRGSKSKGLLSSSESPRAQTAGGGGPRGAPGSQRSSLASPRHCIKAVAPLLAPLLAPPSQAAPLASSALAPLLILACVHPRIQQVNPRAWLALLPKSQLLQRVVGLRAELARLKTQVQREAALSSECQKLRVELEKQKEKESELEGLLKCIICVSRTRSVALAPCLHFYFCQPCSQGLTQCPICRGKIASRVQVKREQAEDESGDDAS